MTTRFVCGHMVVGLFGNVDSATSAAVRDHLLQTIGEQGWRSEITVDLSGVEVLEAAGVSALMLACWRATSLDNAFYLVAPHSTTREVLFAAGVDWLAPIYLTVEDAVTSGPEA